MMTMDWTVVKDIIYILLTLVGWVVTISVMWTRMRDKVDGLGRRVTDYHTAGNMLIGRVSRMEQELSEYHRDQIETSNRLGRIETFFDEIHKAIIEEGTGTQKALHDLELLIHERHTQLQLRLTRIETVLKIPIMVEPQ